MGSTLVMAGQGRYSSWWFHNPYEQTLVKLVWMRNLRKLPWQKSISYLTCWLHPGINNQAFGAWNLLFRESHPQRKSWIGPTKDLHGFTSSSKSCASKNKWQWIMSLDANQEHGPDEISGKFEAYPRTQMPWIPTKKITSLNNKAITHRIHGAGTGTLSYLFTWFLWQR